MPLTDPPQMLPDLGGGPWLTAAKTAGVGFLAWLGLGLVLTLAGAKPGWYAVVGLSLVLLATLLAPVLDVLRDHDVQRLRHAVRRQALLAESVKTEATLRTPSIGWP